LSNKKYKVAVVGGAGHIGLPLSCFISSHQNSVLIVDTDNNSLNKIGKNIPPFKEEGLEEYIKIANKNNLKLSNKIEDISNYELIIVTLGTSSSKSDLSKFESLMNSILENISDNAKIILRSTITNETIDKTLNNKYFQEKNIELAYCPERIAEGKSLEEIKKLPQIIGISQGGKGQYFELFFNSLGIKTQTTEYKNVVFLKLFTNAYRYAEFSIVNEFYNIAVQNKLDYDEILDLAILDYPRLKNIPSKGFVGGPCLIKDTETFKIEYSKNSQLLSTLADINSQFMSNIIGECKEIFVEKKLIQLGLTFKPNSDDLRDSLSLELYYNLIQNSFEVYPVDANVNEDSIEFKLYDYNSASKITNNVLISTFHDSFHDLDFENKKVVTVGSK